MSKKPALRKVDQKSANAKLARIKISPRKLGLIADLIRGLRVEDAIVQLTFSRRRASKEVKQLLLSAIANAENNHQLDIDNLYVSRVNVGKSLVMKRFRARARGRVGKILKPFSNIEIIVTELEE